MKRCIAIFASALAAAGITIVAPWTAAAAPAHDAPKIDHLGSYRASDFVAQAALLPEES
ncbi:hypothetical protein GCM10025881_08010 [Pseudolysinimonas kribbensis]|uniref:Uncharacterized protein n=1 Tax=Pseudolysinimonas kribbensis TaxID=433641 RepID=A0ABQ6K540_9MICO|nr:hypothetical protein [Pseudolysinimonas kribbensis]GMA93977.1 hypothetical protein GCM10025881_08010 [Pseudolysinimonas kribbensis]